ncbi:aldehyde dehydrogenase family protein [Nonomuraea roseola]|uniref:Aldehyde dehydrogenase family protein n=1 Tax=Nonomuraea roseola TaxID=46179 RepID=A0ABV5QEN6_9ACTN
MSPHLKGISIPPSPRHIGPGPSPGSPTCAGRGGCSPNIATTSPPSSPKSRASAREAHGEVERALAVLEFTAGEARRLKGVTTPADEPRTFACTFRVPIGVVGLITP